MHLSFSKSQVTLISYVTVLKQEFINLIHRNYITNTFLFIGFFK